MSHHFSPKSLLFYSCAIVSVTTLFCVVSAYGEANLKPPNKIDGRYQIDTANLPGCLKAPLLLAIQQSGIYLTGAILPVDTPENDLRKALERPPLTGRWDNEQLQLQGALTDLPNCQERVNIQGSIQGTISQGTVSQAILMGTVQLTSVAGSRSFEATQLAVAKIESGSGH